MPSFGPPPSLEDLSALAERALLTIPPTLARRIQNVGIAVEEMPDEETLAELGIESEWELTGLYRGTPLTQRSVTDPAREPDLVILYRQPILLEWVETNEDLFRLVRNVVIHEIAHHFGIDDDAIAAIEREPE